MKAKRLTYLALLTTIALIIFTIEAQIPAPVPIPGIKLGLANIVTVYASFTLSSGETILILFIRIFLGSLFTGNMLAMLYSLGGGAFCLLVTLPMAHILRKNQMWIASVIGAVFHNLGQITVAALVMKTLAVFVYLPPLLISGLLTGAFTGLAAQALTNRLQKN